MLKAVYGGLRNTMFYLKKEATTSRFKNGVDNAARYDEFSKQIS